MQKIQHYDIAIIGSGITGLSTAHHLAQDTDVRVCLSVGLEPEPVSRASANMITGGLIDNFTRISQRHGMEHAKESWLYSNRAYDALMKFAKHSGLEPIEGARIRLIESEDEFVECTKAVEQLKQAGFSSEISKGLPEGTEHLLAQQIDQPKAATLDTQKLLNTLQVTTAKIERVPRTLSFTRESQHFSVKTEGESFTAAVIVLANHLQIPQFLPGLSEVILSTQDQSLRMSTGGKTLPFPVGSLLTWRHGHYWASIESATQLSIGGARFLRPLAGFEANKPELSEKVSKHLPEAWKKYFPTIPLAEHLHQKAGLDCRPCDEIPVIGPMFGETGIFLGAGYMGQGMSLGFKAGQSLANLVLGKSDELPRFFWPERHRSLAPSLSGD
ncbi:MAG: FAD-binding oxidoreductase [Chitinophagaceae bacterium]|nr:FAD-binding oxidoreductase [Oligoflexus sp.]